MPGLLFTSISTVALAQTEVPPLPYVKGSPGFDPYAYFGKCDAYNCPTFTSQAEALVVLRADPDAPNRLDADKHGVACERDN